MHVPGFSKTHSYGIDLSHCATLQGVTDAEMSDTGETVEGPWDFGQPVEDDADWAGQGYDTPYEERNAES